MDSLKEESTGSIEGLFYLAARRGPQTQQTGCKGVYRFRV